MEPEKFRTTGKEFVFHRGCSFNISCILATGLIKGGKERKEGRQTIFFTRLNPFGENSDAKEPSDDLSRSRNIHYHSKRRLDQDAFYWIIIVSNTRLRITILANKIKRDYCIYMVISQKGERTLLEILSTPRPAPSVTLTSRW